MSRKTTKINSSGAIRDNALLGFYNGQNEDSPFEFLTLADVIVQINADSAAGDYTASDITNVAAGDIVATDVQAAIDELDTEKLAIAGGTMTGPLITDPSEAAEAGFNLPAGLAPSSPNVGDIWYDGTDFHAETAAGTVTLAGGGLLFKSYALGDVGTADTTDMAGFIDTPATDTTLTMGGTETQTYGTAGNIVGAHAFIVPEGPSSFAYDVTVSAGTTGNLVIDIDATDYTEAFAVNFATTCTNWIATHTAALGGLGTPIVPTTGGAGIITLVGGPTAIVITDDSTGDFAFIATVAITPCTITVSGVSITDAGVKNDADIEVISADCTGLVADTYYETTKKWLGQVTYTLTGEAGVTINFNYGFCKYEDFGNRDFTLTDIEFIGRGGASETGFILQVLHVTSSIFTYHATAFAPFTGAVINSVTDMGTNDNFQSGSRFAYKRAAIEQPVVGSGSEGLIVRVTAPVNNSISSGTLHIGVRL